MRLISAAMAAIVLTGTASSQAAAGDRISLSVVDAPLVDVISALEDLTGRIILVTPRPSPTDIVTATIVSTPVDTVLTDILKVHGFRWQYGGPGLRALGVMAESALIVRDVRPGSTAERMGLKAGDIVTEINGRPVETSRDAGLALAAEKAVRIAVRREGRVVRVEQEQQR